MRLSAQKQDGQKWNKMETKKRRPNFGIWISHNDLDLDLGSIVIVGLKRGPGGMWLAVCLANRPTGPVWLVGYKTSSV